MAFCIKHFKIVFNFVPGDSLKLAVFISLNSGITLREVYLYHLPHNSCVFQVGESLKLP